MNFLYRYKYLYFLYRPNFQLITSYKINNFVINFIFHPNHLINIYGFVIYVY